MSAPERRGSETDLAERGRSLVETFVGLPREALRFLGHVPLTRRGGPAAGAPPGAMVVPVGSPEPKLRVLRYGPGSVDERDVEDPAALRALVDDPDSVAWVDVEGFGNQPVIEGVGRALGIHPLAMADVVHVPQRSKVELHDDRLLAITQMARVTEAGNVDIEQVSLVMGPGWVVSFQERPGDVFDPIRTRIRSQGSRIREMGADFLLYSLVDAVIDGYFPVVEALGGVIAALEEEIIDRPDRASLARIHATRRTLLTLHRVQWRQRDAVSALLRDETLPLGEALKPYLRDAHDHAFQTLDAIETYRDMVIGLMDLHLSNASLRLSEVMKTLTIVATIFIPLTFLAGVYGMNFDYMPELRWRWGYPAAWLLMVGLAGGLLLWFRRRGWLGARVGGAD